jgi:hypothetical protein
LDDLTAGRQQLIDAVAGDLLGALVGPGVAVKIKTKRIQAKRKIAQKSVVYQMCCYVKYTHTKLLVGNKLLAVKESI